jgi:hypothetical protein
LETVALDGVKIASNASLSTNRSPSGLAKCGRGRSGARIAEAAVSAHAATDAAEDAMFGEANPELVPAELADPDSLAARIEQAKTRLDAHTAADPDDPDDPDAPAPPAANHPASAESVGTEPVPRDRLARITATRTRLDAEIAADRAEHDAAARELSGADRRRGQAARSAPGRGVAGLAERGWPRRSLNPRPNTPAGSHSMPSRLPSAAAQVGARCRSSKTPRVRQQRARQVKARAAEGAPRPGPRMQRIGL